MVGFFPDSPHIMYIEHVWDTCYHLRDFSLIPEVLTFKTDYAHEHNQRACCITLMPTPQLLPLGFPSQMEAEDAPDPCSVPTHVQVGW